MLVLGEEKVSTLGLITLTINAPIFVSMDLLAGIHCQEQIEIRHQDNVLDLIQLGLEYLSFKILKKQF